MLKLRKYHLLAMVIVLMLGAIRGSVVAQEGAATMPEAVGRRPDAPAYAVHGPYWVGLRDDMYIENGDRSMNGYMWYPAQNPEGREEADLYSLHAEDVLGPEFNMFPGQAILNAVPDLQNGPYPLILFSHGWAIGPSLTDYLLEHLASYGFVVVAIEHPGGSFREQITLGFGSLELAANWGPAHVQWVQDSLRVIEYATVATEEGGEFAGLLDVDRIGMIGYSFGGNTALQLAGMRYDFAGLEAYCASIEGGAPEYCSLVGQEGELASLAGQSTEAGQLWRVIESPVVDAVVGLDPGYLMPFGAAGLMGVEVPLMLIGSTMQPDLPPDENALMAYNAVNSDEVSLVLLENANHYVFVDCGPWTPGAFMMCADSVWDMDRARDLIDHFVSAFLLDAFYESADAGAVLLPAEVQFAGITYQTTRR